MFLLFSSAMLPFLAMNILATSAMSHLLQPRQASSSSPAPGTPGVFATFTSSNGTDLSSSFQTLLYLPENDNDVVPSNITDRDLSNRQIPAIARQINRCRTRGAIFRSSRCEYLVNHPTSLQRYQVQCDMLARSRYDPGSRIIIEGVGVDLLLVLYWILRLFFFPLSVQYLSER